MIGISPRQARAIRLWVSAVVTYAIVVAAIVIVALTIRPHRARADELHKLTVAQAIQVLQGLQGLDGHQVIVKQNGQDTLSPPMAWEFGNAILRQKITNDIAILLPVKESNEKLRQAMLREALKGKPPSYEIKDNTPEGAEINRQWEEAQQQPAPGTQDLAHFKLDDLKLDRNEIPGTTTALLKPILD